MHLSEFDCNGNITYIVLHHKIYGISKVYVTKPVG